MLLVKSAVTLVFVITFFFLHSAPDIQKLSLGWTALLGAVLLLILADRYPAFPRSPRNCFITPLFLIPGKTSNR